MTSVILRAKGVDWLSFFRRFDIALDPVVLFKVIRLERRIRVSKM
jgi:hypothetical protein